ncbi:MAG: hypothetical protein A3K68_07885 [Euryarchaeota archaeon RBG_16_68_13]|nr:MAG: hypothetical protein A3K68_07885 [Euryarchaeota archaeon RBG_16_68_13]
MHSRARFLARTGSERNAAVRRLAQATDNVASPRDVGGLLAAIVRGRAAPRTSCRTMLAIMRDQLDRRLACGFLRGPTSRARWGRSRGS